MALEGKISVKHFLNKRLKPLSENRIKKYPLYVRLGFQNRVTDLKSQYYQYVGEIDSIEKLTDDLKRDKETLSYVSEKEFEEIQSNYKLLNEQKVIFEIADFYRRKDQNIIGNAAEIIETLRIPISSSVTLHLKKQLKDQLLEYDEFLPLAQAIDWSNNFSTIYRGLKAASNDGKSSTLLFKKIINNYDEELLFSLANFKYHDAHPLLYQWEKIELKKSLREHLLRTNASQKVTFIISLVESIFRQQTEI